MGRGFLTGAVLGALVSGTAVVVISQQAGTVDLVSTAPEASPVELPPGTEFNRARPDEAPLLPGTEARPAGDAAPVVAAPDPEAPPEAVAALGAAPEPGEVEGALTSPPPRVVAPEAPEVERAVLPVPGIVQPREPGVDSAPTTATGLGAPATGVAPDDVAPPDAGAIDVGAAPALDEEVAVAPEIAPAVPLPGAGQPDSAPTSTAPAAAPSTGEAPSDVEPPAPSADGPGAAPAAEDRVAALPDATSSTAPALDDGPAAVDGPTVFPQAGTGTEGISVPTPSVDVADPAPQVVADPPEGLRLPVPDIGEITPGLGADTLPRVGDPPEEVVVTGPALQLHAEPWDSPKGAPRLAVVLLDTGAGRPDPATLADFPVPLTVALDPTGPDVEGAMAEYRAAGVEVVVLAPIPPNATPADVEVAFEAFMTAVPQSVAVLDMPDARLQANRPRAAQVAAILSASGHGLLTYERGLNAGLQVAEREGVPAASVELKIDEGDRNVAAIRRFLDQGAFRARQSGAAVVIGETKPETIQALAEWVLGTRAASVALVPLSGVLGAD